MPNKITKIKSQAEMIPNPILGVDIILKQKECPICKANGYKFPDDLIDPNDEGRKFDNIEDLFADLGI